MKQFDFGQNWDDYSSKALTEQHIKNARVDFEKLTKNIDLKEKTFIDIGFGQGLSLLIATEMGAKTIGCDINPKCKNVLEKNRKYFDIDLKQDFPIIIGSILDDGTIEDIKKYDSNYNIVHSWGVLHHTGKMWDAIKISSNLVDETGYFILAIYNKNWTSKLWLMIKKTYNFVPGFLKKLMLYCYLPLIYIRTLLSGQKILKKGRGMDFYHDAVDWLGGYPFEYATKKEVVDFLKDDFDLVKFIPTWGFSGCNQFIFRRKQ